jgi:hypothetical protein
VGFCKRYEGQVCPFHRGAYSAFANSRHAQHRSSAS